MTMNEETWYGEVEEKALAEEFCGWLSPMRDRLADDEWRKVLGVRRGTLVVVLREKKWSRGSNKVRKMWLAERTHYLPMSYEEVKAEYDAKVEAEREAKAQAEADALGAETEVHDGDAPYAIATDGSVQPASGVSDESIGTDSTPLAGKPRDVELGDKPDATLPDAELPDENATPSKAPSAAPDASALTPVTETPVETPVASDEAPAASGDAPVGSDASAQPLGTPLDVVPAAGSPDAPAGDAPADAPAADTSAGVAPDAPVADAPAGDAPADAPAAGGPVGNASAVNASLDAPAASVAGAGAPSEEVDASVAGEPASGVPIEADEDASGADASESDAAAGDATPTGGDATAGDASGSGDAGAGALGSAGAIAEVKLSLTGEPLMPAGLDLEDMIALVDASNAAKYGQDPFTIEIDGRWIDVSDNADFKFLRDLIAAAQTREEVARLCDAPVLAVYPGLSLENAKICAILRVSGWHPTQRDKKPPGLYGDAPLMLYYGIDATFVDPGAMAVAFAKTMMWNDSHDLSAMRMRYGVPQLQRRKRYAVEVFNGRPYLIGYRQSDWIPEFLWPDHDWLFGSPPWQDPAGRWWPSRAQLIEYWYRVHDTQLAFAGSEAETRNSAFWLEIEREKLLTEHLLIGEPYMMTFYFHGFGRTLPHSTRIAERRVMRERIAQIDEEVKRRRRSSIVRRVTRLQWSSLFGKQLKRKRVREFRDVQTRFRDAAIQEKIEIERVVFEKTRAELQKQVADFEATWGEIVLKAKSIPPDRITYDELYGITYVDGYAIAESLPSKGQEPGPKSRLGRVLEWILGRPKALVRLVLRLVGNLVGKLLRAPKAVWRWVRRRRLPFGISFTAREEDAQTREDRIKKEKKKADKKADKLDEKLKKQLAKDQKAAERDLLPRHRVVLLGIVVRRAWPFGWFRYKMYEVTGQLACGLQNRRWERWYEPGSPILRERYDLIDPLSWYKLMPEVRIYRVVKKK